MDASAGERRNCPNCGGLIAPDVVICPLCGYKFRPAASSAPTLSGSTEPWRLPPPSEFRENPYAPPRAPLTEEPLRGIVGILLTLGKILFSLFLIYLLVLAVFIAGAVSCAVVAIPTQSIGAGVVVGLVGAGFAFYVLARGLSRLFSRLWGRPVRH